MTHKQYLNTKRKIYGFALFLLLCLMFSLTTTSYCATPNQTGVPARTLIAVVPANIPPTYFLDKGGKPTGFAVEVLNALARKAGMTVKYVVVDGWDEAIDMVITGKADLIPSLAIDDQRIKLLAFTESVEFLPINLIVASSNNSIREISPGLTIGVMEGSTAENYLKQNKTIRLNSDVNLKALLFDLLAGHVDGVVTLKTNIMTLASEVGVEDKIKVIGKPILEGKRAIAVRKGETELVTRLNKAINEYIDSAEYQDTYLKWYAKPKPYWTAGRIGALSGVLLFFVVCGMVLWRYRSIAQLNTILTRSLAERKRAEEESRQLASVVRHSRELVNLVTPDGRMVFLNDAGKKMLGISEEEVAQTTIMQVIPEHLRDKVQKEVLPAIIRDGYWEGELKYRNVKTDGLTDVYATTYKIANPETNALQFLANVSLDITERKRAEEAISAKNKELESYLYVASHDLRSPLVNIQGFSQRLQKQADSIKAALVDCSLPPATKATIEAITDEGMPKALNFIFSSVTKMETLLNGLLHLSRTGRSEMTIEQIDINQLFKTIIANYNFQLTELDATIATNDLPPCNGDANLLGQLFSNIIGNAIKCRDNNRRLVIEIAGRQELRRVIYSIRDNGLGIESRNLEKIWDIFYRVDSTLADAGEGLGLSIVKRIAEKHKGRVWAESEIGKGSVFYIELQTGEFPATQ